MLDSLSCCFIEGSAHGEIYSWIHFTRSNLVLGFSSMSFLFFCLYICSRSLWYLLPISQFPMNVVVMVMGKYNLIDRITLCLSSFFLFLTPSRSRSKGISCFASHLMKNLVRPFTFFSISECTSLQPIAIPSFVSHCALNSFSSLHCLFFNTVISLSGFVFLLKTSTSSFSFHNICWEVTLMEYLKSLITLLNNQLWQSTTNSHDIKWTLVF